MSCRLGSFKPDRVCVGASVTTDFNIQRSDLVGHSNDGIIDINGVQLRALLDTGATVSTISLGKYQSSLMSFTSLIPLQEFELDIEGAGGHKLPYLGYIEVELAVPTLNIEPISCLILVTPDTNYSQTVPVILGTNILKRVMGNIEGKYGSRFQQTTQMPDVWYFTFRCMKIHSRETAKQNGRLAIIRCADRKKIMIPVNTTVSIDARCDKITSTSTGVGITQMWSESTIPGGLSVTPSLVNVQDETLMSVELSNLSSTPVVIAPGSILCQVQSCELVDDIQLKAEDDTQAESWINKIHLNRSILNDSQQSMAHALISQWHEVFSKHDLDVGFTGLVKHGIQLNDCAPFKQRHRKIPHSMYTEVREHLKQLMDSGIVRRSQSPWASNIVLVRKEDQSLRLCIDYRQLNKRTVKDAYALPRIEELLEGLGGNQFYSVLDMKSGYHQVEIKEHHKQYTAFTAGPLGFFEFNRLPFGLSNAPATYQRLMESCLADLMFGDDRVCHIYLDDIIVASKTFKDHLNSLEKVFDKLHQSGLKLSPKKCFLFQEKVKYVGHIVSASGIETDPDKTIKLHTWPSPKNVDELRTFLGFASYYRRFVKGFASIAKPLNSLLTGPGKKRRKQKTSTAVKSKEWEWNEAQESAFQTLKQILTAPPILAYPNYGKPFVLHTDASFSGLGAVLYQTIDGEDKVIAYASRGLSKAELRYPVHKLEFLALKWAVTSKFHDYLYGTEFMVYTDNNPMTYVMEKTKLDATAHRWVAALGAYDFQIKYRTGKSNADADGMSRRPQADEHGYCDVSKDSIKTLCMSCNCSPYVTSLALTTTLPSGLDLYDEVVPRDWRQLQSQDPVLHQFVRAVTQKKKPSVSQVNTRTGKILLREFNKLVIQRGVLYRCVQINDVQVYQLVITDQLRHIALKGAHDDMGHMGRDKTLSVLRERMYWPNMSNDVDQHLRSCDRCIKRKSPTDVKVPMVSIISTQPMELVCIDYLSLEMSKGGFEHLLVITDHYTKYAVAVPTRNQSATVTADALVNEFIKHYGFPRRLLSDQGAQFEGHVIKELCNLTGVEKSRTTPYNPSCNGVTERLNRTLLGMLGTLDPDDKQDWKSRIGHLVHAYNCCRHDSTGYSPYRLMFGRQPRLALDVVLGLVTTDLDEPDYCKYVSKLRDSLKQAYELASRNITAAQHRQKTNHDEKARAAVLEVGDHVLVKVLAVKGKNKIADRWENKPYIVLEHPNPDIPVYKVQIENNEGKVRTLHRKHLLPIGSLPVCLRVEDEPEQSDLSVGDQPTNSDQNEEHNVDNGHDDNGIDEDDQYVVRTEVADTPVDAVQREQFTVTEVTMDSDELEAELTTEAVNIDPEPISNESLAEEPTESQPVERPIPAPRRSTRTKKQTEYYGQRIMSQIQIPNSVDLGDAKSQDSLIKYLIINKYLQLT